MEELYRRVTTHEDGAEWFHFEKEETLTRIKMLEQALEDIKTIAIQAMTESSPMPNALTWDCFVRIRNAVDRAQAGSPK